ncbi:Transcriptional regulatory protein TdiR [Gimesia panareensis]|uniref:Transcriptional regulatory protein TdiR n=1 Tax=Gimesia panareensis TaxID=2527978 RepID=A0A518FGE2_9PLAN|nr:response regulator [Gimesia panareensis]QDV15418.1 Transcriptional regulatory protein TdiR [Gimesia panareensis]
MERIQRLPAYYHPRVYIIDDHADVRDSYVALLQSYGLHVEAFASAEDFLSSTAADSCGCVLTDFELTGCNGLELLKNMKAAGYRLPTILVSGSLDPDTTGSAVTEGAFAVLEKPYPVQSLCEAIITAIQNDSQQRTCK